MITDTLKKLEVKNLNFININDDNCSEISNENTCFTDRSVNLLITLFILI